MPPLSAPTTRQLALIKYMLQEGELQSRRPSPLFVTALLSFQDAAELFLHLACEHHHILLNKQTQFLDYFSALSPVASVLHRPGMDRLNRARVNFKHHGNLPNDGDMEFFRVTAKSFFDDNTPPLFGVTFAEVSLIDLVGCEKSRELLRKAREQQGTGNRQDAAVSLRLAFDALLSDYRDRKRAPGIYLFDLGPTMTFMSSFSMDLGRSDVSRFVDATKDSIERLRNVVELLVFGLDCRKYARFALLTPMIQYAVGGNYWVTHRNRGGELVDEEFEFCFSFIIESAVKLQEFDFTLTPPAPPVAPP